MSKIFCIRRNDAIRLVQFENKRYSDNLLSQFCCDSPAQLLRLIRNQLTEICCYDGSKLLWSSFTQRWMYYQYD